MGLSKRNLIKKEKGKGMISVDRCNPFRLVTLLTLVSGATAMAGVNFTFVEGGAFDNVGIGATMTETNRANPTAFATLTSWDILASAVDSDLSTMTSARASGAAHKTNVRLTGMGINNAHISGDESSNFKKAESWIIKFDKEVYLTSVDLDGMSSGDTMELLVGGVLAFTFDDQDAAPNDPYDLGGILVPAGTEVTFLDVSGGSIRIETISVTTVSETVTLGLII
ncbi:hypothetical protein P4E94_16630 [Pontiellaceae bacterium B12219]|nr:hypothetical protein [Pontiellaceae bacterium B12219]